MARDLVTGDGQVHRAAEAVLAFWLYEVPPEKRFARDDALDRAIADRFADLRAAVIATHAAGWRAEPRLLLAAVILIDQFGRNLFRGSAEAFAADPLARALAGEAETRGFGQGMTAAERQFLWMPFMHGESMADQLRSIALQSDGGTDLVIRFAHLHAAQIARFGRFPQRNAALGRETTADEAAFLADPSNHF
ncbi:MAG: DUF924 domain-containing protein [Sphingomonas fennica]